ncbi:DUF4880 domain-containing protein [Exilibacterium tricleocarpae]|uniref:DUF4880 domain-containing protein n=1 Tax=Exilibacterium tricleocarpae TaxID=2591008 RepID=A0A545SY56_9GAMM|nr:DUF4880 domain-containing protein [Exilibacterium tricleocarpae]TQV69869.1 DUF4880 domain-containing protein [Exilibacterium tricleocarpae]
MSTQQRPPIEQEAIKWFTLVRSDQNLAQHVAEFEVWFHANIAHSRAYREIEKRWEFFGQFADHPATVAALREARNTIKS